MQGIKTQNLNRIQALDGIRGIACLLVLQSHLVNAGYIARPALQQGLLGVTIFFVLSGFLMGFLYLQATSRQQVIEYLLKRFFRVYPLYFFLSVIAAIIAYTIGLYPLPYSPPRAVFDLNYLISQLSLQKGWGAFWTIPIEMHFYLMFAAFLFFTKPIRLYRFLLLMLIVIVLFNHSDLPRIAHRWLMEPEKNSYEVIWKFMGIFFTGACFGAIYKIWPENNRFNGLFSSVAIIGTLILLFFLFTSSSDILLNRQKWLRLDWRDTSWLVPLVGFYIFSCANAKNSRLLIVNSAFFRYTGKISYSLYLWHLIIFCTLTRNINLEPTTGLLVSITSSYLMAILSYKFIEVPCIDVGAKINQNINYH
jgi:peptidoglycan/LPS O-acetylase OafA/YrhL